MNGSSSMLLPIALLIVLLAGVGYPLRKNMKNEAPGPQGQRPYGVHGWLAFYIVALYYFAPLYAIANLIEDLSRAEAAVPTLTTLDGYATYKAGSWLLVLATIAVHWRSAWLLHRRWEPSSVRFAKILALAGPIVVVVGDAILGAVVFEVADPQSFAKGILAGLVRGLIWAAYFQFSQRVRNTYYPATTTDSGMRDDGLDTIFVPPAP